MALVLDILMLSCCVYFTLHCCDASISNYSVRRSLIPSLIPSPPTRRLSSGGSPSLNKPGGRQAVLVDGKRKSGNAK